MKLLVVLLAVMTMTATPAVAPTVEAMETEAVIIDESVPTAAAPAASPEVLGDGTVAYFNGGYLTVETPTAGYTWDTSKFGLVCPENGEALILEEDQDEGWTLTLSFETAPQARTALVSEDISTTAEGVVVRFS